MVRPINNVDDASSFKILRTPSVRVDDATQYADHIADLIDTCTSDANCVGLASSQIWNSSEIPPPRIFCALLGHLWTIVINPTSQRSGKRFIFSEGCMSRPGIKENVKRREAIELIYYTIDGSIVTKTFRGLDAIIVQHEMDHLAGKLI